MSFWEPTAEGVPSSAGHQVSRGSATNNGSAPPPIGAMGAIDAAAAQPPLLWAWKLPAVAGWDWRLPSRWAIAWQSPSTRALREWLNMSPIISMPPRIHWPEPANSGWSNWAMPPCRAASPASCG